MIFQQEFNPQHLFSPIHLAAAQIFSPKATTVLSREERLRLRKEERRRRKLQELKSGCKRFIAMLFSHIGLSGLVIAYTIIGGIMFGNIERRKEKETKTLAYEYRIEASNEFLHLLFSELQVYLTKQPQSCNNTIAFMSFILDFLEKEKPKKSITSTVDGLVENSNFTMNATSFMNTTQFFTTDKANTTIEQSLNDTVYTNSSINMTNLIDSKSSMITDLRNITQSITEQELDHIRGENSLKTQFIILLRGRIQIALMEFTKRVVDFIETDGWNGNDSMEDLKWSFAGSVLYAITVITTIGYGHATPKTDTGKLMTILYALIGIPLMFLYLSNIGDYLADVFRVIYSRTCRTSCDRFCSASIFSLKNDKTRMEQLDESALPVDNDPSVNPTHATHGRRRKRVLLQPFTVNTTSNIPNDNHNLSLTDTNENKINLNKEMCKDDKQVMNNISNETNKGFNRKWNSQLDKLKNKQFFIKLSSYLQKSRVYIAQSRLAAFFNTDSKSALAQAKSNLRELFHPTFTWIQQMVKGLIYQDENANASKPTEIPTDGSNIVSGSEKLTSYPNMFFQNIHHGPEFDLLQNTVTSNMTSNTMKNLVDSSSVPNNQSDNQTLCRTTAMVERNDPSGTNYSDTFEDSKHLYEYLTKQQNQLNKTMKLKYGSTCASVPDGNYSTLSNTFTPNAYMFTSPTSLPTSATIPVQNQPALYNLQKESAKYFTYDGQHRKFYLMARYLRSVQRQRRHKRRVRKRLQEQARAELKRKENEKLYGTLLKHKDNPKMEVKRRTAHRINSFDSVSNDKVSTGSTILSESETEYVSGDGTIRLLCWKDIDIDLEVRSLDEENNETQTLKSTENIKVDNPEEGDTSTVIVNTNVCDIKSHLDRTYSAKDSMHRIKRRKIHCKTPNSKSFSNFKQVAQNELSSTLSCKTSTNDTLDHTGMSSRNAILGSNLQSPRKPTFTPFKPQENFLQNTISSMGCEEPYDISSMSTLVRPYPANMQKTYNQVNNNKVFTSKSGVPNPPAYTSFQQSAPFIPVANMYNKNITPTLLENFKYPPLFTLPYRKNQPHPQQFQYSTIPLVPQSYGLQSDAFQKLLQSTVISNPYATCETASHDIKPEQLGRSRLSLASSRGDLDSEVVVQLSYYSQRGSVQSEEDLSFFSYRDGFVADEDVSKVTVPISLSLVIMTTYILIGAIVFSIWQDPDYLKWSYFCFITLSTIGFGDIVPGTKIDSTNPKEKLIIICLYVAIGLSVFAMCFKLMQEEVVDKMKWFAFRIGILKKKETNETTDKSFYPMSRN